MYVHVHVRLLMIMYTSTPNCVLSLCDWAEIRTYAFTASSSTSWSLWRHLLFFWSVLMAVFGRGSHARRQLLPVDRCTWRHALTLVLITVLLFCRGSHARRRLLPVDRCDVTRSHLYWWLCCFLFCRGSHARRRLLPVRQGPRVTWGAAGGAARAARTGASSSARSYFILFKRGMEWGWSKVRGSRLPLDCVMFTLKASDSTSLYECIVHAGYANTIHVHVHVYVDVLVHIWLTVLSVSWLIAIAHCVPVWSRMLENLGTFVQ